LTSLAYLFLAFAAIEILIGLQIRRLAWRDPALWRTVLYSSQIRREPGREIKFALYGFQGEQLVLAEIRLNNMGLFSARDYQPEKPPGEFRVVILGGEQTASSVCERSWPDFLEDELNAADSRRRYRVINLAWPDAGPEHYVKAWQEEGIRFCPDLVIVNFVETDFYRGIQGAPVTYRGHRVQYSHIAYRVGTDLARTTTARVGPWEVKSLRARLAVPARPYAFFVAPDFLQEPMKVKALQRKVIADMIAGAMPRFGLRFVQFLRNGLGTPRIADIRTFDSPVVGHIDVARLVDRVAQTFGSIAASAPNAVFAHSFHYGELDAQFELTRAMMTANPAINVVDMRLLLPKDVARENLRPWWLIPHMGEKWSLEGHRQYAKLMARVVLDRGSKQAAA
jgi:hypothetical protein